jgi:phosphatidylserine decarboxylase
MSKFSWPEMPSQTAFPIAKAGFPFIIVSSFATLILALGGIKSLALIGLLITFFICYFFRDPDRLVPEDVNSIISPADGKVIVAERVEENPFVDGPCMKISIFMSVFNVHVNRISFGGIVKKIVYFPGKFINAAFDKASEENEHNAVIIETDNGKTICMVQIAGLIARRIICGINEGDKVIKGRRFGLICFGSRLDVYVPADVKLNVSVGDKVQAGNSILGNF